MKNISPEEFLSINYKKVSDFLQKYEQNLINKIKVNDPYNKLIICNRISQILAHNITEPILREYNKNFIKKSNLQYKKIYTEDYEICNINNIIKIKSKLFYISIIKFLILWSYILIIFTYASLKKSKENSQFTLFHGVPFSEFSDEEKRVNFEEFCKKSKIGPLVNASEIIIHSNKKIRNFKNSIFKYERYPIFGVVKNSYFTINDFLQFFKRHSLIFFIYFKLIHQEKICCLLWRDFSIHSLAEILDNKNLIKSNLITNTNWLNQDLWMSSLGERRFKTYMVLYSLNSSPIGFRNQPTPNPHPSIKYLRSDYIFIWHKCYEKVLIEEKIHIKSIIVPPVTWHKITTQKLKNNNNLIRICIFDVTPFNEQGLRYRGMVENYYNLENMKKFITDSVNVINSISLKNMYKFEIHIKHKRAKHINHESRYFDYIKYLEAEYSNFKIIDHNINLYEYISTCNAIIVIPFSSPVFIADYLSIPSIFYDPTDSIIFKQEAYPESLTFAGNKVTLNKAIIDTLKKNEKYGF